MKNFGTSIKYRLKVQLNFITILVNQQIILEAYKVTKSKYSGDCVSMQITFRGKKRVIFTGSVALASQCKRYEDKMPYITTIVRNKNTTA